MKNIIGLVLLIALSLIAYFVFFYQPKEEKREDFKDFSYEDTASITKIFISQPNGKKITLSRKSSKEWLVNNDFPARNDAIELILITLHDVKVLSPVSKASFNSVVKRLASGATKVEFYAEGSELVKTWYVGDAAPGRLGTYMLLEKKGKKSKNPYVTHMLMERGFLGARFFLDPNSWKDPIFLKLDPKKIRKITVEHAYDTATSFSLTKNGSNSFEITNLENKETFDYPSGHAVSYFKEFSRVVYEYLDTFSPKREIDSIFSSSPRHNIHIEMESGKQLNLKTFNMPVPKDATLGGKPIDYDPERMYAFSSYIDEEAYPVVQNLTFDVLIPTFEQLWSSTNVEK